jgi:hypothetical protein
VLSEEARDNVAEVIRRFGKMARDIEAFKRTVAIQGWLIAALAGIIVWMYCKGP